MPPNKMTRIKRRELVEQLYIAGVPTRSIHKAVTERFGKVAYGTVRNDVWAIRKKLAKGFEQRKDVDYSGEFLSRSMDLYRRAVSSGDLRTAYTILKDIAVLFGVDLKATDVRVKVEALSELKGEQLDAEVINLAKLAGVDMELINGGKN